MWKALWKMLLFYHLLCHIQAWILQAVGFISSMLGPPWEQDHLSHNMWERRDGGRGGGKEGGREWSHRQVECASPGQGWGEELVFLPSVAVVLRQARASRGRAGRDADEEPGSYYSGGLILITSLSPRTSWVKWPLMLFENSFDVKGLVFTDPLKFCNWELTL